MPSLPISTLKENQHRYSSLSHLFYQKRLWAKQPTWLMAYLVNEIWKEEQPSSTAWCGPKKVALLGFVVIDFSTGRSTDDAPERWPLRMMRVEEMSIHALRQLSLLFCDMFGVFLSRNANASVPSTIESRDGKSITHSLLTISTLKGDTRAKSTTIWTQSNGGQKRQVYSSLQKEMQYSGMKLYSIYKSKDQYYRRPKEASLFITPERNEPLSNTTWEQFPKASSPNRRDFKLGMSNHHFILW